MECKYDISAEIIQKNSRNESFFGRKNDTINLMKIISGSSNQALAKAFAAYLKTSLCNVEMFMFPDGERRIRIIEDIVEQHVIIIQSTSTPVDEHYMELFFLIDSARRSGASQITVIMPYFGYQRQDHVFRDGEAVSLEVIIQIFQSLKIDNLISIDMHTSRIPDLFPSTITVSHLSALQLFAQKIKQENWITPDTILISPDMGGIRRVKILSELLSSMPYAAIEKNRDLTTGSLNESKIGKGNIKGKKNAIIIDDMIASGGTIHEATKLLRKSGIKEIMVFTTHAVFSPKASEVLSKLPVSKIFVTDSVKISQQEKIENLEILSITPLLAKEVSKMVK